MKSHLKKPISKEEKARREKVTQEHKEKLLKQLVNNIFQGTPWDEELKDVERENMRAINFKN